MPRKGNTIAGKYVLDDLIGEGSMGEVWRAVHQALGRRFAIKFLKAYGQPASRMEERFIQEARLAGSIQHRFVVDIVDFGVTDEGTPYMVMELLEGESLGERLGRAPALPVRDLVALAVQALGGLEAVHRAGVIHRDLKPENIVLVPEADGVIPKLVDFGISRMAPGSGAQRLTQPGATIGTPAYMSPEQARGVDELDPRTDVYSMGVILYEALTGVLPYPDHDLVPLLSAITTGGAPPLIELRPTLGRRLSYVVARAMEVDPDRRYDSARQMSEELMAALARMSGSQACPLRTQQAGLSSDAIAGDAKPGDQPAPLLAHGSGSSGRLHSTIQLWHRRTGIRVALGCAAAIAIVTGGVVAWGPPRTRGLPQRAEAEVSSAASTAKAAGAPKPLDARNLTAGAPGTAQAAPRGPSGESPPARSARARPRQRAPDLFRQPTF